MPELAADPQTAEKDYSWAEYLDCMEGGSDVLTLPQAKPARPSTSTKKDHPVLGLSVAVGLTVIAVFLSEIPVWPFTMADNRHPVEPVMLAIILGMILSNVWSLPKNFGAGIKYSVKKLLPLGIIFLGARLNFLAIVKVGFAGVLLSVIETVVALSFLLFLARKMKLPRKLGLLLGVGTAICGGTAIVATAPVIEAEEKDVVFSVATVTLLGLIAMFLLPVLGTVMHLSEKAFGIWAGLSIHQTPQVIAAGFAYGKDAGETATIVKLARVCLLAPVVFLIGIIHARSEAKNNGGLEKKNINYIHLFPMFILGFLGMALLRTMGFIPDVTFHLPNAMIFGTSDPTLNLAGLFENISKYCIIISMAGVGLETKFSAMKQTGAKPFLASLLAALLIGVLILVLIKALGI
ncbi:MAG: YeiH family protein [Verrucomicrobiota bacterium]